MSRVTWPVADEYAIEVMSIFVNWEVPGESVRFQCKRFLEISKFRRYAVRDKTN